MSEKNIEDRYRVANNISEEILRAIDSGGDISESESVRDFMNNDPQSQGLIKRLTSENRHSQFVASVSASDREGDTKRLVERINQAKDDAVKHNRRKKLYVLTSAVASCAAILVVSLLFWGVETNSNREVVFASQVENEITEPTLVLEGGERVLLSELMDSKCVMTNKMGLNIDDKNKLSYAKINEIHSKDVEVKYNTLIMPAKSSYCLVLGDGTEIFMNAGSKLIYPIGIHSDMREVTLEGEAYFQVAKSSKPFIIAVGGSRVKVYGTEFNLRNTKGEIETVLVEGSIGFTGVGCEEKIITPSQRLVYNKDSKATVIDLVNTNDYLLWQQNFFSAKEAKLHRVLSDISSWYGIKITASELLLNKKITMVLPRDDKIDDVLNFVADILNVKLIVERKGEYRIE